MRNPRKTLCIADTPFFNFSSGSYMQIQSKTFCHIVNHLAHAPFGRSPPRCGSGKWFGQSTLPLSGRKNSIADTKLLAAGGQHQILYTKSKDRGGDSSHHMEPWSCGHFPSRNLIPNHLHGGVFRGCFLRVPGDLTKIWLEPVD